jgi:uncharacterized protein YqhQ
MTARSRASSFPVASGIRFPSAAAQIDSKSEPVIRHFAPLEQLSRVGFDVLIFDAETVDTEQHRGSHSWLSKKERKSAMGIDSAGLSPNSCLSLAMR